MKKTYNLFAFLILLVTTPIFAQYTSNDTALVKTTFERNFDKVIVNNYLHSNSLQKINAALLSIAQSEDTSFILEILKLDFTKNAKFICFSLGQLGPNSSATDYLFSKLNNSPTPDSIKYFIIKALCKTGNNNDFKSLEKRYKDADGNGFGGISIGVYDLYARKVITKEEAKLILHRELTGLGISTQRKSQAAFAIARLGLSDYFKKDIYKLLANNFHNYDKSYDNLILAQYLVNNLRRAKYVPFGLPFFRKLLSAKRSLIRNEAASFLINFPFKTKQELNSYFEFFRDNNANVTRQAAISLKGISVPGELTKILRQIIEELILKKSLSANTRGELLLSYQQLFKIKFDDLLKDYQNVIDPEFIYRAASANPKSESAYNYLTEKFDSVEGKEKNDVISAIINFKEFSGNLKFKDIIFSSLCSNSPVLISMAIYGIDSTFIANYKRELEKVLSSVVSRYMNDPNFYESVQAAADLSKLLNKNFNLDILRKLQHSDVYALRKYADEKLGIEFGSSNKDEKLFRELWSYSFKYKSAEVVTEKGKFTIKFTRGYAPISAGNFSYLASKHFFDGIIFHRVVPAFVIQGGDPTGTGWGGPEYSIVSEFSPLHYSISAVGMASAGKDSEGSQWFVTTGDFPHLDGRYTIFGYVTDGMKVVNRIDQNDKIVSVNLSY